MRAASDTAGLRSDVAERDATRRYDAWFLALLDRSGVMMGALPVGAAGREPNAFKVQFLCAKVERA